MNACNAAESDPDAVRQGVHALDRTWYSAAILKLSSNTNEDESTSGYRTLSSAQSSCRLFCARSEETRSVSHKIVTFPACHLGAGSTRSTSWHSTGSNSKPCLGSPAALFCIVPEMESQDGTAPAGDYGSQEIYGRQQVVCLA